MRTPSPILGAAYIEDINVVEERELALSKVGAIVETPKFYPYLTPDETLSYLGRLRGMREAELKSRMHACNNFVMVGATVK